MADPAEFSPVELDRMEDALETLELADVLDEPSIAVRRRLGDYRKILELSRAAMPLMEVPRGLLDHVLAEARAAAEVPVVAPAAPMREPVVGLWTKVRRALLLPGVALATTAALVLLIVERDKSAEAPAATAASDKVAVNEPAPARQQAAGELREEGRLESQRAKSDSAAAVTATPAEAPASGTMAPPPSPGPGSASPTDDGNLDKAGGVVLEPEADEKKRADAPPFAKPSAVADLDAMPRWDTIARGDRARHKMDCAEARSEYTLALDDMDARVRARAHAGLGLCEAAEGDRRGADAAYKQARELDAEIVGFIEAERPRGAGSSNQAKAAKAKKAAPPAADNAMEQAQLDDPAE